MRCGRSNQPRPRRRLATSQVTTAPRMTKRGDDEVRGEAPARQVEGVETEQEVGRPRAAAGPGPRSRWRCRGARRSAAAPARRTTARCRRARRPPPRRATVPRPPHPSVSCRPSASCGRAAHGTLRCQGRGGWHSVQLVGVGPAGAVGMSAYGAHPGHRRDRRRRAGPPARRRPRGRRARRAVARRAARRRRRRPRPDHPLGDARSPTTCSPPAPTCSSSAGPASVSTTSTSRRPRGAA